VYKSLGISFSGGSIFFTELYSDSVNIRLDNVEEVKVDFDFEDEFQKFKSSQKDLTNISSEIEKYITKRNAAECSVSLAISTAQAFLITLPIDFSEGKQSLYSKISWELSNYFPDNYNDFVINTYRLNSVLPFGSSDEFLIIAVTKNSLEFVKRIFKICRIELALIDIDHFAAEYALRNSYPEKMRNKNVMMVGLKSGRVDYGYITDKKYRNYAYSKSGSETEFNLNLVRKINSLLESKRFRPGLDRLFLYGNEVKEDTVEALKKIDGVNAELINPFVNIGASDLFLKDESLRKTAYRFAPSCGAALRSLSLKK